MSCPILNLTDTILGVLKSGKMYEPNFNQASFDKNGIYKSSERMRERHRRLLFVQMNFNSPVFMWPGYWHIQSIRGASRSVVRKYTPQLAGEDSRFENHKQ
jgi:hypothetical protein